MPVTLESRARRMQVFHLPHEVFCRDECACVETTVILTAENPRTGDRGRKHVPRKLPSSMTWLALERRTGLPGVLLEVPEIRAAISRGDLRLVEQTPDRPADTHAQASSTPVPASSTPPSAPSSAAGATTTTTPTEGRR